MWAIDFEKTEVKNLVIWLTTSGVDAPSVCEAESALLRLALLLLSPGRPSALVPGPVSLSSITKSMGIFPFRQLMYRWQKLSQSSWTCNMRKWWGRTATSWPEGVVETNDQNHIEKQSDFADANATTQKFSIRFSSFCKCNQWVVCMPGVVLMKSIFLRGSLPYLYWFPTRAAWEPSRGTILLDPQQRRS